MFPKDFKEFIALLNSNSVEYLVVGGYAVAFHGYPRYTGDLDIWLSNSPDNVSRVLSVLEAFGFGSLGLSARDFLTENQIVQLGYPPLRIDLLTGIDGVKFGESYKNRVTANIEDLDVAFISIEDLKKNKRASNRFKDRADLENLS